MKFYLETKMQNTEEKEKRCENCKYFGRYYVAYKNHFRKAGQGICHNRYNKVNPKNVNHVCRYWEEKTFKAEDREEYIKKTLDRTVKSLDEITIVLKLDAEV